MSPDSDGELTVFSRDKGEPVSALQQRFASSLVATCKSNGMRLPFLLTSAYVLWLAEHRLHCRTTCHYSDYMHHDTRARLRRTPSVS